MPSYRIETEGFGASERDIRAICDSTGRELWRYFRDCDIEPFVVTRGHGGPIVLHDRNGDGEITMRLDTGQTFWCQYAYQFAHEFCHILCGYQSGPSDNKWFEETICETASLFALRAMARTWTDDPPYPNWRDFRDALRSYADDVIASRQQIYEIHESGLPAFYRNHEDELRGNPNARELNGAMSIVMLRLFEEDPRRWQAVHWINRGSPAGDESLSEYLQRWHDAVPDAHKAFVRQLAQLFGQQLESDASP
jgi:hypothetical protein